MRTTGETMTRTFKTCGEATVYGNGGTHTLFLDKTVRDLILTGSAARYILSHVLTAGYDFMFIKNIDSFETRTLKIQKSVDFIHLKLPMNCPRTILDAVKEAKTLERISKIEDTKVPKKVITKMPKRVKDKTSDYMLDHYQETMRKPTPLKERNNLRKLLDRELDQISRNVKAAKKKMCS